MKDQITGPSLCLKNSPDFSVLLVKLDNFSKQLLPRLRTSASALVYEICAFVVPRNSLGKYYFRAFTHMLPCILRACAPRP